MASKGLPLPPNNHLTDKPTQVFAESMGGLPDKMVAMASSGLASPTNNHLNEEPPPQVFAESMGGLCDKMVAMDSSGLASPTNNHLNEEPPEVFAESMGGLCDKKVAMASSGLASSTNNHLNEEPPQVFAESMGGLCDKMVAMDSSGLASPTNNHLNEEPPQVFAETMGSLCDKMVAMDSSGLASPTNNLLNKEPPQVFAESMGGLSDKMVAMDSSGLASPTNNHLNEEPPQVFAESMGGLSDKMVAMDSSGLASPTNNLLNKEPPQVFAESMGGLCDKMVAMDSSGLASPTNNHLNEEPPQMFAESMGGLCDKMVAMDSSGLASPTNNHLNEEPPQVFAESMGGLSDKMVAMDSSGLASPTNNHLNEEPPQVFAESMGGLSDKMVAIDSSGLASSTNNHLTDKPTQVLEDNMNGLCDKTHVKALTGQESSIDEHLSEDSTHGWFDETVMKASPTKEHLKGEPTVIEERMDGLYDETGPLSFLTQQEYKDLFEAKTSEEGVDKILDIILQRGSPACEKFLDHLDYLGQKFPSLKDMSRYLERLLKGKKAFYDLVESTKMNHYLTSKLTLRDILSVGLEDLHDMKSETIEDLPWNYLRKIMALNRTARSNLLKTQSTIGGGDGGDDDDDDDFSSLQDESNSSSSIHPLDVLCVLLHCSDTFLQQEIVTKMAMCQFAIPLLLPMGDSSHYTLMLWAMRDIVKRWRPQSLASSKGFREENVVNISMPIFSFVRLGKNKLSKSKMLNIVLNTDQQLNNFFIHDNMDGGNLKRKISDGLVEMSWYFPSGKSDVFPEPIAVTNLRGDLESNWNQFMFLTRVSSAVFIFMESISERESTLLSSCSNTDTQYYFIVTPGPGKQVSTETLKTLQDLKPKLNFKKSNVIKYGSKDNEATFVKQLQDSILSILNNNRKINIVRNLVDDIHGLHTNVDERSPECQEGWKYSCEVTKEISNVAEYKQKTMKLQGDLWKDLSKIEKELCRMANQGDRDTQHYEDKLKMDRFVLHEEQYSHDLPNGIMLFINAIMHLSNTEKQCFLKWMKFKLDSIARNQLSELQAQYKEKCSNASTNKEELKQIDKKISDSSLGIEHFLREMGQHYEAECSMFEKNKTIQRQFTSFPGIAADLLIDGFPLELIDGDVSNIPLQWITDVLTQLNKKTGGKYRMRVITVLGVQSTGKSTLLNTMFGLQFPVSSGRCTRGAFMTLLNVKANFREELGCEFIMVIDTEGLKAPELASLEGSYEHDNELATLVVGLSDITIVNMAMENTTEMKDILQIVVHAFLRMKEIGKKPNCQFVHQNVSDVSAHDKNMRDRGKLLEQLNEMTKVAAEMEKKSGINAFSDVMDYDLEKDNWYFPGLWLGDPPMAPVNSGYSEHVFELKKYLLEFLKRKKSLQKPLTIPEFITWIESLWNAVKHEKFIFSFRNSLVAEAYNNLSIQFSQWEWEFRKSVHNWLIGTETIIKNQTFKSLNEDLRSQFQTDLRSLLCSKKAKMLISLENYFANKNENVHLIERYKEDFVLSTEALRKELERNTLSKCDETISIKKGKFKIQDIQNRSQKLIEDKITDLIKKCQERNQKLNRKQLKNEFTAMWEKTLKDLKIEHIRRQIVGKSVLQQLSNDMSNKGPTINQELKRKKDIEDHAQQDFKMDNKYIGTGKVEQFFNAIIPVYFKNESYDKIKEFALSLIDKCDTYVKGKVSTAEDYNDTYCQEILHMINTELSKQVKALRYSSQFELDIKLHILGKASREFQKMHDRFIKENDPELCLANLRPQYLETFISTFQDKDVCQTKAREFCKRCLKPAITAHVFQRLGTEIVQDILHGSDNKTFSSRTFFQNCLLKELLEELSYQKYVTYILSYKQYAKAWISSYIRKKYEDRESLKAMQKNILSSLTRKISIVLADDKCLKSPSVTDFLKYVFEMLNKELVIPQNEVNVVTFQNTASVQQFSSDIQLMLEDTETKILSELQSMDIASVLSKVTVKPVDELCRKVVGCGKQCPFCKVPCEGSGDKHQNHFATLHRSQGLGRYRWSHTSHLMTDICTTLVVSTTNFENHDTEWNCHPYKDYRKYYPDWSIQPDSTLDSSDYWKYIFVQFNERFATEYEALPADIPDGWKDITKEKVLESLKKTFNG
ncbi:interferon-induced very large GTPase 1-like isoform X1 [Hyperolius riggenbachi]|uniref:interferon-induced very large GTPase 1-like isoform X1 n=1 Tax=Hyperolius riggenbachi TaxID=752182 RepID=UPI0035A38EEB